MKLPSSLLSKLCLTGATVVAVAGCEPVERASKYQPKPEPVRVETVEVETTPGRTEVETIPTFAQPPPGVAPRVAPTAPRRTVPKKQPVHPPAHECGPCGMG